MKEKQTEEMFKNIPTEDLKKLEKMPDSYFKNLVEKYIQKRKIMEENIKKIYEQKHYLLRKDMINEKLYMKYYTIKGLKIERYKKGYMISAIKRKYFQKQRLKLLEEFIRDNDFTHLTLKTIQYIDRSITGKSSNFQVYSKIFKIQEKNSIKYFYENKAKMDKIDYEKYIDYYHFNVSIINQIFREYKGSYAIDEKPTGWTYFIGK